MMTIAPRRGGRDAARPRRLALKARPEVSPLEGRWLQASLAGVEPTAEEQYMLQLVNRARANPQAEGQRLASLARTDPILGAAMMTGDLTAFLAQIDASAPSPPLAFNTRLIAASRDHNAAMLAANAQFHAPSGFVARPNGPGDLAADGQPYFPTAGSSWSAAENVFAYSANLPDSHGVPLVDYFHAAFMLDWGNPGFGHLKNILLPGGASAAAAGLYGASEIGIGLMTDARPSVAPTDRPAILANKGLNVGPALVTQEFAWRSGHQFLTGAIYSDANGDRFYTPGEGMGGVLVQAVGREGQGTFAALTWGSGGYSLDLPSGTYDVTASGAGLATPRSATLAIGADNVGWDVAATWASAPTFSAAVLPARPVAAPVATPAAQAASAGRGRDVAATAPSVRVVPRHKKRRPRQEGPKAGVPRKARAAELPAPPRWRRDR